MIITLTYIDLERARVALLRPASALDRSNYDDLIAQAWAARAAGAHYLILDLRDVERVGIAGLVGLYAVARLAQGAPPPDPESGWAAIRALAEDHPPMWRLAVVNPRPQVRQALASDPFVNFLAIHADLDAALAAQVRGGPCLDHLAAQHRPANEFAADRRSRLAPTAP
jgi:hypothetical protein